MGYNFFFFFFKFHTQQQQFAKTSHPSTLKFSHVGELSAGLPFSLVIFAQRLKMFTVRIIPVGLSPPDKLTHGGGESSVGTSVGLGTHHSSAAVYTNTGLSENTHSIYAVGPSARG